jgi:hypothetical protein
VGDLNIASGSLEYEEMIRNKLIDPLEKVNDHTYTDFFEKYVWTYSANARSSIIGNFDRLDYTLLHVANQNAMQISSEIIAYHDTKNRSTLQLSDHNAVQTTIHIL